MSPRSELARDLARALIRCHSVTPEDGGALAVLEERLKPAGFATHRLRFTEAGTPDIDNLYARIGTGAPTLVFAGHTDVVPPGDTASWRFDPFSAEIADGTIWGRGASDMRARSPPLPRRRSITSRASELQGLDRAARHRR